MRQFEFLQVHLCIGLSLELIFVVEFIFEFVISLFFNDFLLIFKFWFWNLFIYLFWLLSFWQNEKLVITILFNDLKTYSFFDKLFPYIIFKSDKIGFELSKITIFLFSLFFFTFSLLIFSFIFSCNEEEELSSSLFIFSKRIFLYFWLLISLLLPLLFSSLISLLFIIKLLSPLILSLFSLL